MTSEFQKRGGVITALCDSGTFMMLERETQNPQDQMGLEAKRFVSVCLEGLVSFNDWLEESLLVEFNVPVQHKYGCIRDKRSGVERREMPPCKLLTRTAPIKTAWAGTRTYINGNHGGITENSSWVVCNVD